MTFEEISQLQRNDAVRVVSEKPQDADVPCTWSPRKDEILGKILYFVRVIPDIGYVGISARVASYSWDWLVLPHWIEKVVEEDDVDRFVKSQTHDNLSRIFGC